MSKFIIEQYELHVQKYEVEADSKTDAVKSLLDGYATAIDNGGGYISPADAYSRPIFTDDELAEADAFTTVEDASIPSIRSVEEE